jgi:hypothetical protein
VLNRDNPNDLLPPLQRKLSLAVARVLYIWRVRGVYFRDNHVLLDFYAELWELYESCAVSGV